MKVNELERKLALSKAGLAMLEEADRRGKQMAEDEREAAEYAAIVAGRLALAEQFAKLQADVDEKGDEIKDQLRAAGRQMDEIRGGLTSVRGKLAACDRAETALRRLNRKREPLLDGLREQLGVLIRHVRAEHPPFNLDAQKALRSFQEDRIGTDHYKFGPLRKKLELEQEEARKGELIKERLAVACERIGELELEISPEVQGELEKLAEQIGEVLMSCCPKPRAVLPPSTVGLAMGRGVAA